jgi:hypothetical protein
MTVPHGETIDRFAVWGKRGDRRIACEMDLMGVNRRSNLTPLGDGEPRGSCTCKVARADCVNCASLLKVASKQLVGSIRFECQPKPNLSKVRTEAKGATHWIATSTKQLAAVAVNPEPQCLALTEASRSSLLSKSVRSSASSSPRSICGTSFINAGLCVTVSITAHMSRPGTFSITYRTSEQRGRWMGSRDGQA